MRDKTTDPADTLASKTSLKTGVDAGKDAKLAAALRANLMRRKAAARQASVPRNTMQDKDAKR